MVESFTKIQNEILDALVRYRLPGEQVQILLFIIRKTIGFNKKTDAIPLSQFVKSTGINRGNVARAIRELESKNLISIKKGSVKKDTITISEYRFNGRFDQWISSVKKDTGSVIPAKNAVSKKTHSKEIYQKKDNIFPQNAPSPHQGEDVEENLYLTKKRRKLTGKRLEAFEKFWTAFAYKKDRASAADAWIDIPALTDSLVETICKAAEKEAENRSDIIAKGRTPIYAQGWLTSKRWEDEDQAPSSIPILQLTPEEQIAEFRL